MDTKKEQKIIVFVDLTPADKNRILHGIKLATIFKKELCLFYHYAPNKEAKLPEYEDKLQAYITPIKREIPSQKVSLLCLSKPFRQLPAILSEEYEGILFVADSLKINKVIKILPDCTVPVLFIHPDSIIVGYNRLIQPVDLREAIKDSTIWCSYFGRFNNAEIVLLAANNKLREYKYNIVKNIEAAKSLFERFELTYKVLKGQKRSLGNAFEALEIAKNSDCNLLVILGSSSITPLDLLVGLPEKKIVRKAGILPVLVINPRRDNYILCD